MILITQQSYTSKFLCEIRPRERRRRGVASKTRQSKRGESWMDFKWLCCVIRSGLCGNFPCRLVYRITHLRWTRASRAEMARPERGEPMDWKVWKWRENFLILFEDWDDAVRSRTCNSYVRLMALRTRGTAHVHCENLCLRNNERKHQQRAERSRLTVPSALLPLALPIMTLWLYLLIIASAQKSDFPINKSRFSAPLSLDCEKPPRDQRERRGRGGCTNLLQNIFLILARKFNLCLRIQKFAYDVWPGKTKKNFSPWWRQTSFARVHSLSSETTASRLVRFA